MKFKECPAFKLAPDSAADDAAGQFEAIVSVFGNVDRVGDVVMPGAFADSLAAWKASGDPIPVLWSHRMDDPRYSIGSVVEAEELEPGDKRIPEWADPHVKANGGLWVLGQLHTGEAAGEIAVAARRLLKGRLVKQFSYAYDIEEAGWGVMDGLDVYELRKLAIHEVSPTQVGCNDLTQLLGAKAAATLTGDSRVDLADLVRLAGVLGEQLREAAAALGGNRPPRDGDTTDGGTAKNEEPDGAKFEEPTRDVGSIRLRCEIERQLALSN